MFSFFHSIMPSWPSALSAATQAAPGPLAPPPPAPAGDDASSPALPSPSMPQGLQEETTSSNAGFNEQATEGGGAATPQQAPTEQQMAVSKQ